MRKVIACSALGLLTFSMTVFGLDYSEPWDYIILDELESYQSCSLKAQADGYPAVVYRHPVLDRAVYAWQSGNQWDSMIIPEPGVNYPKLAFDASGNPAFCSRDGGLVKYHYYDGTSWTAETVATDCDQDSTDLVFPADGQPVITYYASTGLRAARQVEAGSWSNELVDSVTPGGMRVELGMDVLPTGEPAIAFFHENEDAFKYAWKQTGAWSSEVIATVSNSLSEASIAFAVSPEGYPTMIYLWDRIAQKVDGNWQITNPSGSCSSHSDLLFLEDGTPAVAIQDRYHFMGLYGLEPYSSSLRWNYDYSFVVGDGFRLHKSSAAMIQESLGGLRPGIAGFSSRHNPEEQPIGGDKLFYSSLSTSSVNITLNYTATAQNDEAGTSVMNNYTAVVDYDGPWGPPTECAQPLAHVESSCGQTTNGHLGILFDMSGRHGEVCSSGPYCGRDTCGFYNPDGGICDPNCCDVCSSFSVGSFYGAAQGTLHIGYSSEVPQGTKLRAVVFMKNIFLEFYPWWSRSVVVKRDGEIIADSGSARWPHLTFDAYAGETLQFEASTTAGIADVVEDDIWYSKFRFSVNLYEPIAPPARLGDVNRDGAIDDADITLLASCVAGPGVTTPPAGIDPADFAAADMDNDGDVDLAEIAYFQALYQPEAP